LSKINISLALLSDFKLQIALVQMYVTLFSKNPDFAHFSPLPTHIPNCLREDAFKAAKPIIQQECNATRFKSNKLHAWGGSVSLDTSFWAWKRSMDVQVDKWFR